jgi:NAD(P)-dependent dehydrogenase (short-subunit alcohol dehydrogenase family)
MSEASYSGMRAYADSKLLNIMDAMELHRQCKVAGDDIISVSLHPGGYGCA